MPRGLSAPGSQQIKVVMPAHLYAPLWQEAKDAGVTMADLVRIAVKERYERKTNALTETRTLYSTEQPR